MAMRKQAHSSHRLKTNGFPAPEFMNELELMTSEGYWRSYLTDKVMNKAQIRDQHSLDATYEIYQNVMKLIKLLKDEIPDYSTRFTH